LKHGDARTKKAEIWLETPQEYDYPAVRGDLRRGIALAVAYHRVCA
jgi:hypothetical protein